MIYIGGTGVHLIYNASVNNILFCFFVFHFVGGHSTFFALLNTFVHIVMYFYYMVSAMGPKYQKYIWWKKYLTSFQMVRKVLFKHTYSIIDYNIKSDIVYYFYIYTKYYC